MPDHRPAWPGGARCAVTLTCDNFGEALDLLKYGHAGGALADGVYAPRRGIERILNLLDRHRIPATFFVEGWGARKYAALAREIVAAGHEIGSHGCPRRSSSFPGRGRSTTPSSTRTREPFAGPPKSESSGPRSSTQPRHSLARSCWSAIRDTAAGPPESLLWRSW